MNIDKLTDPEKSVMLARAMGWDTFEGAHTKRIFAMIGGVQYDCELYDPANMALAWRVLNWATTTPGIMAPMADWLGATVAITVGDTVRHGPRWWFVFEGVIPVSDILDKVLGLAIEAGLIPD